MRALKVTGVILLLVALIAWGLYNNVRSKEEKAAKKQTTVNLFSVKTVKASRQSIQTPLELTGTVAANADVMLISETQGRVVAVTAKNGDYLPQGALFVQVEDEILQATYQLAQSNYEKAKKDLERVENLRSQNATTESMIDNMRLAYQNADNQLVIAKRRLNDSRIKMPIGGVVAQRMVDVGGYVAPGTPVANIIDIATLKVKVSVPEEDVFKLRLGQSVVVTSDIYAGQKFTGTIYSIGSKGDEAHTFPVEVMMANNAYTPFKAGMFARVNFTGLTAVSSITVPREALVGSLKQPKVYVMNNDVVTLREVALNGETDNKLVITGGLKEGEEVVISGQLNLEDGMKVQVINQ
jgi:RND family efflux transporter MFP subunit